MVSGVEKQKDVEKREKKKANEKEKNEKEGKKLNDDEVMLNVLGCRLTYIRDKLRPMAKHGSINLYVHGSQKAR